MSNAEDIIYKEVMINAYKYGSAEKKVVLKKLMANYPELRSKINKIQPLLDNIISDVNEMPLNKLQEIVEKKYVPLQPGIPHHQVGSVMAQNIQALICGAISEVFARMVEASGIQLIPFITGGIDDVLNAYINGNLQTRAFWMPGYGLQRRRRFRGNFR